MVSVSALPADNERAGTIGRSTPLSCSGGFQKDSLPPCWGISGSLFETTHHDLLIQIQDPIPPQSHLGRRKQFPEVGRGKEGLGLERAQGEEKGDQVLGGKEQN